MRISYVNGRYLPHSESLVHVEDRGYQFADGVYEYIAFFNRKLVDGQAHLARLSRSLKALEIAEPVSPRALNAIIGELVARNGRDDGGIYIQVTRGSARRDHPFPKAGKPALVLTLCAPKLPKRTDAERGIGVITHPDIRWGRRDIKSIGLLPNVLAKQEAFKQGAREAWLVEEGHVSEGAASNAYIVDSEGLVHTHPADERILSGVTRAEVLRLARGNRIKMVEQRFSAEQMEHATEAFMTSASANVLPVVSIDGKPVGDGRPGPVTRRLRALYETHILQQTGKHVYDPA